MFNLKIKQIRIIAHILFWIGYVLVVTYTFSAVFKAEIVFYRTLLIGSFHIFMVYTNLLVFIPRMLARRRYLVYSLAITLLILIQLPVKYYFVFEVFGGIFSTYSYKDWHFFVSNVVSSMSLLVISTGLWYAEQGILHMKSKQELISYKLESELNMLRNQVNPHFLFNTLNNIYSLAYTKSDNTAPAILKLSAMLRYMLYECQDEKVSLEKEVDYIHNFIELLALKSEELLPLDFQVSGVDQSIKIAPLIFIPFFENAVKHGNVQQKGGWIKSELIAARDRIYFRIENSLPMHSTNKEPKGGIGLENTKRRLTLIYGENYQLSIRATEEVFTVELTIDEPNEI